MVDRSLDRWQIILLVACGVPIIATLATLLITWKDPTPANRRSSLRAIAALCGVAVVPSRILLETRLPVVVYGGILALLIASMLIAYHASTRIKLPSNAGQRSPYDPPG